MKQLSNTLHADIIKFLESIPSHVNGSTVRELEFKRKAAMYIKRLSKSKTIKIQKQ